MEGFDRLLAYLKELGVDGRADGFEQRIRIQKLAYLLGELFGRPVAGDFNFYVRGPYSHELAVQYYDRRTAHREYALGAGEKEELDRLKGQVGELSATMLEIMASLRWLQKVQGLREDAAERRLKEIKPYLKIEDIWWGTQLLKMFMLRKADAKRIMKGMAGEMKLWDDAAAEDWEKFVKRYRV